MEKKVGYLGPIASFTDLAASKLFSKCERIPYRTIPACIDAVENDELDYCIVPLENAIEGSVNLTLDYIIHEATLSIVGEVILPIQQHLMVHHQNVGHWKNVTKVVSHPHALAQCHKFLHQYLQNALYGEKSSTSAAAKFVSEHPEENIAAIANSLAAKEYGLTIVENNIHDFSNNHTRFVILSKLNEQRLIEAKSRESQGFKTTMMITLPSDQSGALHQVLSAFAWRKLNLSKIESRPMKTGLGNYFFIIDIEMKCDDILIPGAKLELEALGCQVKILGSYPYFHALQNIPQEN